MIDWHSEKNEVFINPRLDAEAANGITSLLKNSGNLKGHLWFTTSGTTGKFKFVALSKEAVLQSASAVNSHLASTANDVWINVLPTFHVGGVGIFARGYASGAKVVNLYSSKKRWNPHDFIDATNEVKGTLSALVPAQVHDIVIGEVIAPECLRAVVVGGGLLSMPLFEQARKLGWNLLPSYGLTECSSQVATAEKNNCFEYKILEHVQVKIGDGQRIQIMSPSLLTSYAFIEKRVVTLMDPKINGWFNTEDIGEINGDCLKVFGRGSDFLKVGGESVSLPALQKELDEIKSASGERQNIMLVPHDDDRLGKVVALVVEGLISKPVEDLINQYNNRVLPYERIRYVYSVENIPRTDLGKPLIKNLSLLLEKSCGHCLDS